VNSTVDIGAWHEQWRTLLAALSSGPSAHGTPGLKDAGDAFERFAAGFAAFGAGREAGRPPAPDEVARAWAGFAEQCIGRVRPATALPGMPAPLVAALEEFARVQAAIAADIAQRFAARLTGPAAPGSLRAAFDAWIDCAEGAFRTAAHTDGFALAQARLLNELVALRARQQVQLERVSRLAGLPTRAEVDALYDAVRSLRAALAAPVSPVTPVAPAVRARAPRPRARKTAAAAKRPGPRA